MAIGIWELSGALLEGEGEIRLVLNERLFSG